MSMQVLAELGRAGWFELTRPYPDRGPLEGVDAYNASMGIGMSGAGVVVAANAEGLRVLVSSSLSATFLPWSKVTVSASRNWEWTVIRVDVSAAPSLSLRLYMEDADADAFLRPTGLVLPPCRGRWGPWLIVAAAIIAFLAVAASIWPIAAEP